ncbi:hypothetical protein KJ865_06950, partial [Myxococcota bacterium]|nr:hypothetical protein [Myxococcota bacterium]
MKKISLILISLLAFGLFWACDDDTAAPSLALEEVETSYVALMCEKFVGCQDNTMVSLFLNTEAACVDFFEAEYVDEHGGIGDMIAAVNGGTVLYDAEAAYACLEQQGAQSCQEFGNADPVICQDVFTGTVDDGGACEINEECLSNYCDTSEACPGVCAPAVADGASCDMSDECMKGAKCINGTCQTYVAGVAQGEDCEPGDDDWC